MNIRVLIDGEISEHILDNDKNRYMVHGIALTLSQINTRNLKIELECDKCKIRNVVKRPTLQYHIRKNAQIYLCYSCRLAGKSNPFYGKHHTPETKAAILKTRGPYTGTANPFYGKHHTPETKLKLKNLQPDISGNKNPFWGKKHTQESIIKIKAGQPVLSQENRLKKSKRMANIQARLKKENPELYKEQRARAGKVSLSKQGRYKINKLETKVSDYLKSLGINFEYSTILGHKQFDFGNRESKILIEVQGDYWHGNPEKYSTLNEIQKAIQTKDRAKEQFAYENGFVLFKIWEADVDKNNWEALRGINEIYKLRTNRN